MNPLRVTLLLFTIVYLVLRLAGGRHPRLAHAYLRYVLLAVVAAIIVAPFAWLICAAFKDRDVLMEYTFLPPIREWSWQTINLDNFRELFAAQESLEGRVYFWQYILNSIFVTCAATMLQMFFCSLGGYALAKYEFRGKRAIMAFMVGSLMFPGMLFLAPMFQLIYRIGWMDSYLALLMPGAASVFGIFLFRQAMVGVPDSLIEAARMDGASEFGIYFNILMPLVRPMTAAFCLVSFLGHWNSFIGPQVFIQSQSKLTLPVVLNQYMGLYQQQYGVFLAGTLLAIIPPAILFFALQREFVAGLSSGAVKG